MKLLFTGDINFRGIENINFDKSIEILKILFNDEVNDVKMWQEKIVRLQKMPI